MKIGIIGLGVVGSAVRHGFEKLGHQVSWHDIKFESRIENVLDTEVVYLCVPTPSIENGHCDTSIIEEVVRELIVDHAYQGIIALKSTVVPGTTKKLQERHRNQNICHVPEFLRERVAIADFTDNHDLCIIGTESKEVFETIKESHGSFPKTFVQLSPTEAEISKYFNNLYNAVLITFANAFYELCKEYDADYSQIKSAMVQREHIYNKYLDCNENLRGFGGVCLPKDTKAINALVKQIGLPVNLFEAVLKDNENYKTTVFEGMRQ